MKVKSARKQTLMAFLLSVFVIGWTTLPTPAVEPDAPFPTYGAGPVQVRLYADYFCPPCRQLEPLAEPILKDLIRRNIIQLTMIDVPFHSHTALYAKYHLYALKIKNDLDHSLKVRHLLFETAAGTNRITASEAMEKLFKSNNVQFTVFDVKSLLIKYNALIREDKIDTTPTCVIEKDGKKEKIIGRDEIADALKKLQTH